ncbi:MAG: cytidine deaminase [Pseudomonadota bacterium]
MADTDDLQELFEAAHAARDNAHAPYSGFAVGAAIRSESGRIYAGCNVENASYPEGWCAETSAIAQMVSAGEKRIMAVLVMGGGARLCTPCGGCRQRLAEFAAPDTPIHIASPDGIRQHTTLQDLLPGAFTLLEEPS